ncbi:MAG: alpha/beta fold hydrolase [Polyangiaceae bacterium]|nr:alpha/beta fold hydrolase [Polyangiaceae bacterium]
MRPTRCWLAAGVTLWLNGCGSPVVEGEGGAGGEAANGAGGQGEGGGGGAATTPWQACPLYVDRPNGPQAECATFQVPLRWSEPEGPTIGIFVQRLLGDGPRRSQLWLLEGGPGGSGADFDEWMAALHQSDPALDLYAIDHRGVGRSARLTCEAQETPTSDWGISVSPSEAAACHAALTAQWGGDLAEFSTTAAARDLGHLIEVNREDDLGVLLYSVSYGTYWAHRYLQLFPDQASGVVLDSIAPPGIDFVTYDEDFDRVGRDFLALCAADGVCSAKLGSDPWSALESLASDLDAGHCAAVQQAWGLNREALRLVLAVLLMSPITRTYLPATIYRLQRCEEADVAAIDRMLTLLFGDQTTSYYDTLSSDALFYNVSLSELWPDQELHPTLAEIEETESSLYITTGLTPRVAAVQSEWPAYADDAYVDAWASTQTPILMLNGDLDPMTPLWLAELTAPHFTDSNQHFVIIPRAAHCVTAQTPTVFGQPMCGLEVARSFFADPMAPPDTRCLDQIPAESFAGDPGLNNLVFGTVDLWENVSGFSAQAEPSRRVLRQLKHVRRSVDRHLR